MDFQISMSFPDLPASPKKSNRSSVLRVSSQLRFGTLETQGINVEFAIKNSSGTKRKSEELKGPKSKKARFDPSFNPPKLDPKNKTFLNPNDILPEGCKRERKASYVEDKMDLDESSIFDEEAYEQEVIEMFAASMKQVDKK